MKQVLVVVIFCWSLLTTSLSAQPGEPRAIEPKSVGSIERNDPALDELIPQEAKIEAVADGFRWSEGPVWLPKQQCVVFSDVPTNTAYSWSERDGLQVFLKPSGNTDPAGQGSGGSNGLALDHQGRLLLCQHGDRRVARLDAPFEQPQSKFVTLIDKYEGKRFNSPNDLALHSSGSLLFTDPPFGLKGGWDGPGRELDVQGVYRLDPDGKVTLLTSKLDRPNGIAFSPDEKTLYVACSGPDIRGYLAFDVDEDLELSGERVFFDFGSLKQQRPGNPDGLKADIHGNMFVTGPGGVLVISPTGKLLGTILPGVRVANCGFGDDGSTLYLTAQRYLCRVRLTTTGVGF